MGQWLGVYAFTAGARVGFLVRELKSCMVHSETKIIIIIIIMWIKINQGLDMYTYYEIDKLCYA